MFLSKNAFLEGFLTFNDVASVGGLAWGNAFCVCPKNPQYFIAKYVEFNFCSKMMCFSSVYNFR